ncbi:MAG: ComEA family DNA-binding protein [Solirubrobacterales bacterium]
MTGLKHIPDFNAATKEELERIPGISDEIAEAIIQYRDGRGGIRDFEELMNADEITRDHINRLRSYMRIGE